MTLVSDNISAIPAATDQGTVHVDPQSAVDRVPDESRAARNRSFDVEDFPLPTGREEEWRFTPVDRLGTLFTPGPSGHLAWNTDLPDTVSLTEIDTATARELGAAPPEDRGAVVAIANSGGAMHLDIPVEAEIAEPIRVRLTGETGVAGDPVFGHLVVTAGRHSAATVIVEHDGSAAYSEVVSTVVGDGAKLTVVTVQRWADDSLHLGQHDALVGRDATYRHIAVTLGGAIVRMNSNVRYAGSGGDATLLGVYFADSGQHLEHRSFIDHNMPKGNSLVTYKGALQGESARTVWVGDVLIRAEAEGIDTYELNRNLVLTDGARADSVPNLEIETGDIAGAGHASSTGRFDDEQLFYLMSRGITEDEARRLVVRGFFADVVAKIGVPEIVESIMVAIEEELALDMAGEQTAAGASA
ncbi:MAG: Fe-S cluster assembly protein SufD [Ornithinimicrobium sp.]